MQYYTDVGIGGNDELACCSTIELKRKLDLFNEGDKDLFFIHGFILLVVLMIGIPFLIYSTDQLFVFSAITVPLLCVGLISSLFFQIKGRKNYK